MITVTVTYDSIGVVLTQDARGKFSAERVFINGDKVVARESLTTERAISWATKEARESLERLCSDWQRGQIDFAQPEQAKLKVTEHTKK